jgi:hypothetical protein
VRDHGESPPCLPWRATCQQPAPSKYGLPAHPPVRALDSRGGPVLPALRDITACPHSVPTAGEQGGARGTGQNRRAPDSRGRTSRPGTRTARGPNGPGAGPEGPGATRTGRGRPGGEGGEALAVGLLPAAQQHRWACGLTRTIALEIRYLSGTVHRAQQQNVLLLFAEAPTCTGMQVVAEYGKGGLCRADCCLNGEDG